MLGRTRGHAGTYGQAGPAEATLRWSAVSDLLAGRAWLAHLGCLAPSGTSWLT